MLTGVLIRATLPLAAVIASLVATPTAQAGAGSADRALDAALGRVVDEPTGPPGASALVQRGERISFHRAGVADLRTGRAIHRTDHMRIASTSKAFSGVVALSLVDRGQLDLDGTLAEMLPRQPAAWSEVTLAQLLGHTSGVPDYTADPGFQHQFSSDPGAYVSPSELIGYVADEPLAFAPGSAYSYSNTDNILVGLIAEAATGRTYGSELRREVYRPVGLRSTSLPTTPAMPLRFVHGYAIDPGSGPEDVSTLLNPSGAWASGGIVSTPADLNRFVRAYAGGRLFGPAVRDRLLRFVDGTSDPPGPGENGAGLAIFRYRTDCGTVLGHTGSFPGYTQFIGATRNGRRSLVVSANEQLTPPSDPEVFDRLRDVFEATVCAARAGGHN
jgi:D-alanyl-D-alanine carboxypeptidase